MTEATPRTFHRSTVEAWAKQHRIEPSVMVAFVQSEGDRIIEDEKE